MEFNFDGGLYSGMSTPSAAMEIPATVTYEDMARDLIDGPNTLLHFGMGTDRELISVDLASDSPHVLVSAASGAGKSTVARALVTQALLKGFQVVVLDIKQISHMWAHGLPNVHIADTAEAIGNALTAVGMEAHRRMRAVKEARDINLFNSQRVLVIYEEMNSTVDALKELDKMLPPRGVYKSGAAFGDVMNLGRAVGIHVVGFAQYADNHTVPTRWRESFGYRVLIRHSANQWNMLAWQCGYCPPASQHMGRGKVVQGDRAVDCQFLYLTEEHAASLVTEYVTPIEPPKRRQMRRQARDAQQALRAARGVE